MKAMPRDGVPAGLLDADTQAFGLPVRARADDTGPPPIQPARLVCVVGPDLGRSFPLRGASCVIGRGEDAEVCVASTDSSRHHARIVVGLRELAIEDLGSRNGTYVNGVALRTRTALHVGDRIQIGSTILLLTRHDELEERLQQLQKLEAMGALVKGLAHDFNNLLSVLQGGIEELGETLPATDTASHATLDDMAKAAESAASLVRRLQRIGRHKPPTSEIVDLEALVAETLAFARRLPQVDVQLRADVPAARVRGSREDLRNALLNLVLNARDATPSGGSITITGSIVQLDRASALERHLLAEGAYLQLVVQDTGTGMDEATLARAFEPFFTTKPPGKGSGLGLAMVFSAVRSHRGAIAIESAVGRGTTVRILLPTE